MSTENNHEYAVEALNLAHELDPKAIEQLISVKVNCSKKLLEDHPSLQVAVESDCGGNPVYTVSVMSLINMILVELDLNKIGAQYIVDDTPQGQFEKFVEYDGYAECGESCGDEGCCCQQ